ncbi:hypothetical protein K505DRAFT_95158 [Melanomma pulvis-pyrius CBS 109.77]|uniref:Uncharacterized protein n=1 Tax=Melanomma pulvis-pyrius CBS 109.77 TaxID=1314802 RepID=A0A6A6X0H4_9PLEO|nr:hypothetical protein K505DRAFT_95158 [Melanomma pulvis-pyrius CBS 109.77]
MRSSWAWRAKNFLLCHDGCCLEFHYSIEQEELVDNSTPHQYAPVPTVNAQQRRWSRAAAAKMMRLERRRRVRGWGHKEGWLKAAERGFLIFKKENAGRGRKSRRRHPFFVLGRSGDYQVTMAGNPPKRRPRSLTPAQNMLAASSFLPTNSLQKRSQLQLSLESSKSYYPIRQLQKSVDYVGLSPNSTAAAAANAL